MTCVARLRVVPLGQGFRGPGMDERGGFGLGVRMVLAGTVSALVVASLTIAIGRSVVEPPASQQTRDAPLILISR